ncbi:MAG TPA: glycosyltransferase family 4 protein [bacterium]|nr:glycosyltransferase family 4 protein [bacterium]
MRFLFLVGRDSRHPSAGGGDIQAWEWARYVAGHGHEATYICCGHPTLPTAELISGVMVLRMGPGFLLPFKAYRFYKHHQLDIDLVYEDVIGGGRLPYLSPLYVRKPIVAAWHQPTSDLLIDSHGRLAAILLSFVERLVAKFYRSTWLRAPSEEIRSQLICELGLPIARIRVIPASIPEEWFTSKRVAHPDGQLILCVSNFRRYKGIHTLIKALPLVRKQCEDVQLVIVGRRIDLAYERTLHLLVDELGLDQCTRFLTNINEEEKRSLLCKSRLLVLPSRREGFGVVVLEANACGVPVIASSGVPESVVKDGWNGLRYVFGDVDGLATSIVRLLRSDELHHELSDNGLVFAKRFGWAEVGRQFENLAKLANPLGEVGKRS